MEGEIRYLEDIFSRSIETSDINRLNDNSGGFVEVSSHTFDVLKTASEVSENTNGAFDVTVAPAISLWGFDSGNYRVPENDTLSNILDYIDYKKIEFDESNLSVKIDETSRVDAGGIAKGYIADKAAEFLMDEGVTSALLNFGGNIRLIGSKPDSTPWNIGIKAPFAEGIFANVKIADKTLSTAGGYERYFEEKGTIYHHIIDPSTAAPAKSDVLSSTVIGDDGALCDALSTAVFVMGSGSLKDVAKIYPDLDFITLCDGKVFITENISKSFELSENYINTEIIIM